MSVSYDKIHLNNQDFEVINTFLHRNRFIILFFYLKCNGAYTGMTYFGLFLDRIRAANLFTLLKLYAINLYPKLYRSNDTSRILKCYR